MAILQQAVLMDNTNVTVKPYPNALSVLSCLLLFVVSWTDASAVAEPSLVESESEQPAKTTTAGPKAPKSETASQEETDRQYREPTTS
ncbi:MAG: hypothetical protein ACOC26_06150, partial [Halochromatium sp.]